MIPSEPQFRLRLAETSEDLVAAQQLRYEVFVAELGGDGPMVDHAARREADRFDPEFDHLLLLDPRRGGSVREQVVGVYRLLTDAGARRIGQFYSEDEYDLSVLRGSGRKLLELGRSCLHRDYRGGTAMMHLWGGLAEYVRVREIEVLFGVASFHGTEIAPIAAPLSLLHHRHLAPPKLRVRAREGRYQPMDLVPEAELDRAKAMRAVPALIKAYLKLGGFVGDGAFVDHAFNTTDICLVMDTAQLNARQSALYARAWA